MSLMSTFFTGIAYRNTAIIAKEVTEEDFMIVTPSDIVEVTTVDKGF
jgi:hypothetical protein